MVLSTESESDNVILQQNLDKQVIKGQSIYSPAVLMFYDFWVLGISNSYIWKCPSSRIEAHFNQNISDNHLDVGVGTGYFLDRCQFSVSRPRVALMDLNPNSLASASKRISGYLPETYRCNVLEPIELEIKPFNSISLNYLLHCLPGSFPEKLVVLENLDALLKPGGRIFGSTLLTDGVERSLPASALMWLYNRKGIFSNEADGLQQLEDYLSSHYASYKLEVEGCAVLFSAVKAKKKAVSKSELNNKTKTKTKTKKQDK